MRRESPQISFHKGRPAAITYFIGEDIVCERRLEPKLSGFVQPVLGVRSVTVNSLLPRAERSSLIRAFLKEPGQRVAKLAWREN